MKNRLIEDRVKRLLSVSNSQVRVELESHFPGGRMAGGKYNMGRHLITLYIEEIKAQCTQLYGSLDRLDAYVDIVLAHEIGHAEDGELDLLATLLETSDSELERRRIALRIEENAWAYARELLPLTSGPMLDEIIRESLQAYHEAIDELELEIQPIGA
ncbi:hypothetical protein [Paenibacillus sp. UNC499MF]|uniref:hypothetical protein n=1 Tax=Paenibacillus sp. UNC499MF TaxID=1502751 RepID=UPI0008A039BF|nr:hypothetical protein [Paenibacillus sp. UNC499MF]SEF66397.1 hypothetical protein SAMN02799616_00798 [Paenibacillus sp. UNC499MF]